MPDGATRPALSGSPEEALAEELGRNRGSVTGDGLVCCVCVRELSEVDLLPAEEVLIRSHRPVARPPLVTPRPAYNQFWLPSFESKRRASRA
jgi:hypothetical protein